MKTIHGSKNQRVSSKLFSMVRQVFREFACVASRKFSELATPMAGKFQWEAVKDEKQN